MEDPAAYMARTDFYGYPVLTLFCLFYLHRFGSQVLKNFAYLSAVLLLIISINLNLNFAKTHFFGFTAENKLSGFFPHKPVHRHSGRRNPPAFPLLSAVCKRKIRLLYAAGAIYPPLDCL